MFHTDVVSVVVMAYLPIQVIQKKMTARLQTVVMIPSRSLLSSLNLPVTMSMLTCPRLQYV